ncbi:MAG: glycosyltransferase family 4 protein [Melioribacteraceae bacterium]|nr:glycosyltransferase family 4 protein [Melioribacteraceae bacterium]MCF8262867.1 glycosyltransferase family 4 protein [Melioribacteraceae bacterium]MCF8430905.1 glycosyltransferase family 4 protein [Melioribacteraceae bacterium]
MKKRLGTNYFSYSHNRNFASLEHENYIFNKGLDFGKILNHIYYKTKGNNSIYLNNIHFLDFSFRNKANHFFNTISFSNKPWITSFEFYLPRWAVKSRNVRMAELGLNRLLHNSCKKLIAMSKYAYNAQIIFTEKNRSEILEEIKNKMVQISPSQKMLISDISEKGPLTEKINFVLVGADFFRKGGKEVLKAFDNLLSKGANVNLTIVSSMQFGDYASKSTKDDLFFAKKIIEKYPDNISYHDHLANDKVIEILINSDVALLPSYDETYGYFVLEAQASGCPVITTNGGAFPEINSAEHGWMINFEKSDEWGRIFPKESKQREKFSRELSDSLEAIVLSIMDNPEIIRRKGDLCLSRISENHNILKTTKKLKSIYDLALE